MSARTAPMSGAGAGAGAGVGVSSRSAWGSQRGLPEDDVDALPPVDVPAARKTATALYDAAMDAYRDCELDTAEPAVVLTSVPRPKVDDILTRLNEAIDGWPERVCGEPFSASDAAMLEEMKKSQRGKRRRRRKRNVGHIVSLGEKLAELCFRRANLYIAVGGSAVVELPSVTKIVVNDLAVALALRPRWLDARMASGATAMHRGAPALALRDFRWAHRAELAGRIKAAGSRAKAKKKKLLTKPTSGSVMMQAVRAGLPALTGEWTRLKPEGDVPSPRAGAAIAQKGRKVYLFGGRYERMPKDPIYGAPGGGVRFEVLGDLFVLDMRKFRDEGIATWRRVAINRPEAPQPPPRSHATMVCFRESLFLYGGLASASTPHDDLWAFHIPTRRWQQMPVPNPSTTLPRRVPVQVKNNRRINGQFIPPPPPSGVIVADSDVVPSPDGVLLANSPGRRHSCAHFVYEGKLYLLGGECDRGHDGGFFSIDLRVLTKYITHVVFDSVGAASRKKKKKKFDEDGNEIVDEEAAELEKFQAMASGRNLKTSRSTRTNATAGTDAGAETGSGSGPAKGKSRVPEPIPLLRRPPMPEKMPTWLRVRQVGMSNRLGRARAMFWQDEYYFTTYGGVPIGKLPEADPADHEVARAAQVTQEMFDARDGKLYVMNIHPETRGMRGVYPLPLTGSACASVRDRGWAFGGRWEGLKSPLVQDGRVTQYATRYCQDLYRRSPRGEWQIVEAEPVEVEPAVLQNEQDEYMKECRKRDKARRKRKAKKLPPDPELEDPEPPDPTLHDEPCARSDSVMFAFPDEPETVFVFGGFTMADAQTGEWLFGEPRWLNDLYVCRVTVPKRAPKKVAAAAEGGAAQRRGSHASRASRGSKRSAQVAAAVGGDPAQAAGAGGGGAAGASAGAGAGAGAGAAATAVVPTTTKPAAVAPAGTLPTSASEAKKGKSCTIM